MTTKNDALARPAESTILADVDMADATPDVVGTIASPVESRALDARHVSDQTLRRALLDDIGTLKLTQGQRAKLAVAVATPEIAAIKPTGEVYVPGVHYRRLLNDVFGPAGWGLRPLSELKLDMRDDAKRGRSIMFREYALVVRSKVVSCAIGEAEYHPSNARLTWGDAAESVRTNALTRLCKDLGIYSEAWEPQWTARFRREHCVQVWIEKSARSSDDDNKRPQWRRLDADPFYGEAQPTDDSPNRERWYRQRSGENPMKPKTHFEQPGTRMSAPNQPATTQTVVGSLSPVGSAETEKRQLVVACREVSRHGADVFSIKTNSGATYWTDDRSIFEAAQALARSETPVVIVSEKRKDQKQRDFEWIREITR